MGKSLGVHNATRGVTLVQQGQVADTFFTRLRGLVGVRQLPVGRGLLIRPCNQVHCMFMSIPIDVLYLGRDDRVLAIDHSMAPWSFGRLVRGAIQVLELPAGTAKATGTQTGDQLSVTIGVS